MFSGNPGVQPSSFAQGTAEAFSGGDTLTQVENSSQLVREQNLLALSGSTWKEPGNTEECRRKQLHETHFVFTAGMLLRMWLMTSHSVSFMNIC